jgi:hypothetical protein
MQTALKFFDIPFQSAGGQGANKIGIKMPNRKSDQLSGDDNGFMDIIAALTRMTPQERNTALEQLDWVPVNDSVDGIPVEDRVDGVPVEDCVDGVPVKDSAGGFAPLIDVIDQASDKQSMLKMLLPKQGTDTTPPRFRLRYLSDRQTQPSIPGKTPAYWK